MKMKTTIVVTLSALAMFSSTVWGQETEPVFSYDKERITEAKPWTNKEFQNNPADFQFVIIGDRTGGAS